MKEESIMGQARGIVTEEELKAYGGANIMLLDGNNETFQSSDTASGSYEWHIEWDEKGFISSGWIYLTGSGYDFEDLYKNGQLKATLEENDGMASTLVRAINDAFHWDCTDGK